MLLIYPTNDLDQAISDIRHNIIEQFYADKINKVRLDAYKNAKIQQAQQAHRTRLIQAQQAQQAQQAHRTRLSKHRARASIAASVMMFGAMGAMGAGIAVGVTTVVLGSASLSQIMFDIDPGLSALALVGGAGLLFGLIGLGAGCCSEGIGKFWYERGDYLQSFAGKAIGFGTLTMLAAAAAVLLAEDELPKIAKICILAGAILLALAASAVATFLDGDKSKAPEATPPQH